MIESDFKSDSYTYVYHNQHTFCLMLLCIETYVIFTVPKDFRAYQIDSPKEERNYRTHYICK